MRAKPENRPRPSSRNRAPPELPTRVAAARLSLAAGGQCANFLRTVGYRQEEAMNLVTHKKMKGDRLMPWGKGTVVTGAKGLVFLAGNTGTAENYDPSSGKGGAVGDAATQWRSILTNIKSDLEELGSSLEHLVKITQYVKGPFPDGGALSSPNFRLDVMDEFFAEHCPKHCSYNNPPPSEVIGVVALAHPDLVIEIVAVAALPD
ncbi:RidA family protein [Mesorhizobium sp. B283B1A]|uniref:RidA family protein n=1 Tax=Mesorhizobium TaxID=68287 RepID=UPI001CD17AEE|nr:MULTISPECIES: RidA family protein [Mesorhizobium]MCA0047129.1 RidA family protein [Mesorhizobium sp. B283B1A]UQS65339.1 RidA family protein [Mesorhizobium opportunistum]